VAGVVLVVLSWAVFAVTAFAFVHAARQRSDAYPAANKLTKPAWLGILGVSGLLSFVLGVMGMVIAAVAAGVYLVDVLPKLLEVQGKSR